MIMIVSIIVVVIDNSTIDNVKRSTGQSNINDNDDNGSNSNDDNDHNNSDGSRSSVNGSQFLPKGSLAVYKQKQKSEGPQMFRSPLNCPSQELTSIDP